MNDASTGPPPDRYGRPGRGRQVGVTAAAIVLAAALGSWLLWAALSAATPDVRTRLLAFRIVDDRHVQLRFELVTDRDATVTCTVQAEDRSREVVGIDRVVSGPAAEPTRVIETRIETRDRAVTAIVAGCRGNGQD